MGLGLSLSIALHVAILLLALIGLPLFAPTPPEHTQLVPVDIVRLADVTTPPPPAKREPPKPEPPKPTPPKVEAPKPEPKPEPPKPEPVKPEPVKAPEPKPEPPTPPKPVEVKAPPPEPKPEPKPEPPKVASVPTPEPAPKPKPRPEPPQAKPEPAPEPPKKQAEPKKPEPKKPEPKKDEFAALADSLLKDQRKPAPAPSPPRDEMAAIRSALESSPTQNAVTDRPLSISEQDALRRQLEGCWNVPAGARDAEDLVVLIRVRLGPGGQVLDKAPVVDSGRLNRDGFYRAAVESALRAVDICNPLRLPPEKYALWKDMTLTFNPKDMLN